MLSPIAQSLVPDAPCRTMPSLDHTPDVHRLRCKSSKFPGPSQRALLVPSPVNQTPQLAVAAQAPWWRPANAASRQTQPTPYNPGPCASPDNTSTICLLSCLEQLCPTS